MATISWQRLPRACRPEVSMVALERGAARTWIRAAAGRLTLLAATVIVTGLFSALLIRQAPGFGVDERELDPRLSGESLQAVRAQRQAETLAASWRKQLIGILTGDWGTSAALGRPVRDLVSERAGLTVRTAGIGLAAAWVLTLGACAALQWTRAVSLDRLLGFVSGVLLCVPAAMFALVSVWIGGALPAAVAVIVFPRIFRYAQNIVGAAARQPHVLAAHARGVGITRLLWRHIGTVSAPELLALAGVSVSAAIGAAIPVEALCDSPGLGQLVWQSAMARDFAVLVPMTVVIAAVVCAANLVSDGAAALAGPRI